MMNYSQGPHCTQRGSGTGRLAHTTLSNKHRLHCMRTVVSSLRTSSCHKSQILTLANRHAHSRQYTGLTTLAAIKPTSPDVT